MKAIIFYSLMIVSVLADVHFVAAAEIHKERSIYRNVVITEDDSIRCMRFETRRKKVANQACIDLDDPNRLVFEYAHGVMAGLAIQPKPKNVLVLGLGGGVLPKVLHQLLPETQIVSIDIDPVVVKLAKSYFDYQENEKILTEIKDGRVYVKRALLNKETYDWIILDAFNGDYIPEHLMTQEFLTEVKQLLSIGGLLTANTFSNSQLYDYESVTYQKVFGKLYTFRAPTKGNRVIFACNCQSFEFPLQPEGLQARLTPFKVNLDKVWQNISDQVDWDVARQPLTDQYSPANLLRQTD